MSKHNPIDRTWERFSEFRARLTEIENKFRAEVDREFERREGASQLVKFPIMCATGTLLFTRAEIAALAAQLTIAAALEASPNVVGKSWIPDTFKHRAGCPWVFTKGGLACDCPVVNNVED